MKCGVNMYTQTHYIHHHHIPTKLSKQTHMPDEWYMISREQQDSVDKSFFLFSCSFDICTTEKQLTGRAREKSMTNLCSTRMAYKNFVLYFLFLSVTLVLLNSNLCMCALTPPARNCVALFCLLFAVQKLAEFRMRPTRKTVKTNRQPERNRKLKWREIVFFCHCRNVTSYFHIFRKQLIRMHITIKYFRNFFYRCFFIMISHQTFHEAV